MNTFEEAYRKLNTEQREAVDHIDGPLLVVAGPGTGKTQLLSARVANILKKTDTDPSAILCLTFTNKAAANMRARLVQLVGPSARTVTAKTFHSFAAEIMNMYPDYFWNGAKLNAASDAVQLEIIESILSDLPLDNPLSLTFAGEFTQVRPVRQALKLAKEAGLTPEQLRAIITLNLAYIDQIEPLLVNALAPALSAKRLPALHGAVAGLPAQGIGADMSPLLALDTVIQDSLDFAIATDEPTGKLTHTSKWKSRWIQSEAGLKGMHDERRRNQWWQYLAGVYEQYRDALHGRGYYDYADMLVEVIQQLEQHADLRASVQERFLYVMIDEFQDTNAAQMRLGHLVADHFSAEGKPNIMAVGDDDQSIYKFNGAELNNMLSFQRAYPTARTLILVKNYRSSQAVLDTARRVIELANDRLVKREPSLSKDLRAANPPAYEGEIRRANYASRDHQFSHVARLVQQERNERPDTSIAVLARSHDSLRRLAGILAALHVPIAYEQSNDTLAHPAIQQLVVLAQIVTSIQAGDETNVNAGIARALRHPMWHINPEMLWQLASGNYARADWLSSLTSNTNKELQNIGHWLLWLAGEADYQPLAVMIEYLLGLRAGEHMTSPLNAYYLRSGATEDYVGALSATKALRSLAEEFSASTTPALAGFVQFVTTMRDNGQTLADKTPFANQQHAVHLHTIHGAKGLEFDSVYVIDAIEKEWQPSGGGRKPPANLPLQPNGDDGDDYVRLMYVALTRAKHSLHISSYQYDDAGNDVLATPLAVAAINDETQPAAATDESMANILEEALRWPRLPVASERDLLRARLESYRLSPTHLLDFLDVTKGGPQTFLETKLLGLPEARSARMAFGNAIHAALERAQNLVNMDAFEIAAVQNTYESALLMQALPRNEFDRYVVHGQNMLSRLFGPLGYTLVAGSLPEQRVAATLAGGAELYGKLDRIDSFGEHAINIVDYKSGVPLPSFATRDKTKAVKAWRHRMQLLFYVLLAKESARFKHAHEISGQMVYVESETARTLTLSYSPDTAEIGRLEQIINAVWRHIIALDLPDTSHYSHDLAGIQAFEQDLIDGKL